MRCVFTDGGHCAHWCLCVRPWHERAKGKAVHTCAAFRRVQPETLADPRQALCPRTCTRRRCTAARAGRAHTLRSTGGAGRVGSAFAAELGTMAVSEQTDSLRVLGSDPVDYLVTPRVLACMIAAPILNLMCFAMGAPRRRALSGQSDSAALPDTAPLPERGGGSMKACVVRSKIPYTCCLKRHSSYPVACQPSCSARTSDSTACQRVPAQARAATRHAECRPACAVVQRGAGLRAPSGGACAAPGIACSCLLAQTVYDVSANIILDSCTRAVSSWDVITSMIKSWVFGTIIAIVRPAPPPGPPGARRRRRCPAGAPADAPAPTQRSQLSAGRPFLPRRGAGRPQPFHVLRHGSDSKLCQECRRAAKGYRGAAAQVSCSWGFTTTGGAKGVGESTTSAVVISLVMIFIADFFLSFLFFQGQGDALKQLK